MFRHCITAGLLAVCVTTAAYAETKVEIVTDEQEASWETELEQAQQRLEAAAEEIARLSSRAGHEALVRIERVMQPRAALGINIGRSEPRKAEGVNVLGVSPDGPADKAGLRAGDLITTINGTRLASDGSNSPESTLLQEMEKVEPGKEVQLAYRRDGKALSTKLTTTEMGSMPRIIAHHLDNVIELKDGMRWAPEFPMPPMHIAAFHQFGDMEMVSLTPTLGEYFGTENGILVVRAPTDNMFGLRDGDVIRSIGGREPSDPGHAMRILHSYDSGEKVELEILRKKRKQTLSAVVPERKERTFFVPGAPRHGEAPNPDLDT